MRAGCFAEKRVIDLINRRFVPFFFNRGGPGEGRDERASAFVDGQTENPYAYFAAFSPEGAILGETELYADKDAVFAWLRKLLADHPEYAHPTEDEERGTTPGELAEQLGDYDRALAAYASMPDSVAARIGEMRVARYLGEWKRHAKFEQALRSGPHAQSARVDADLERGRRLIANEKYEEARALLQPLTHIAKGHPRLAEVHYYAGVACWFDDDRDWAKLHWCWVAEHMPNDRLQRRAYITAAAEAMPYANPELGGYEADVGNIGTRHIQSGYGRALQVHQRLLDAFERGEWTAKPVVTSRKVSDGDAARLAAELRDGNDHVPANNEVVDLLVAIGEPALAPLIAQITDVDGQARGYSAWALANVLIGMDDRPKAAMEALTTATRDANNYVKALSQSGLRKLHAADREKRSNAAPEGERELPPSPTRLVALLIDGNEHRVANNRVVDRLEAIGVPALPSLVAAIRDPLFDGRGYAAWALSQVLKTSGSRDETAMSALREAAESDDPYVETVAKSGLSRL